MNFKELANIENLIYALLLIAAIAIAITRYNASSTVQTIAAFYCIIQLVINISRIYGAIKLKVKKKVLNWGLSKTITLVVSFVVIAILFFAVLTDFLERFVLYYAALILGFLLVYDVGKMLLKKSF